MNKQAVQAEYKRQKEACIEYIQRLEDRAPHRNPPSAMDKRVLAVYEKHVGPPDVNTYMEDRLMSMDLKQLNALMGALEEAVK